MAENDVEFSTGITSPELRSLNSQKCEIFKETRRKVSVCGAICVKLTLLSIAIVNVDLKVEPRVCLFSENSGELWARIGEQVLCRSVYSQFFIFVIMRRIHSRHFQISEIDKYWRILFAKVVSRDYSSIYARTPENVEYSVFTYSRPFSNCMMRSKIKHATRWPTLSFSLTLRFCLQGLSDV